MRRKLATVLLVIVIQVLQSVVAGAVPNPDTGPGCGLGKKLWSDSMKQKSIIPQVLMATTNVTGFQTFAITSGTSGCSNDGKLWADEKVNAFVAANSEDIEQDLAKGGGEHLASLAILMRVPQELQPEFFSIAQAHYFSMSGETNGDFHKIQEALRNMIAEPQFFAKVQVSR